MVLKKLRCRLAAYSVLWTLAFGMFAPALGHTLAVQKSEAGFLVAVCTATGIQYMRLEVQSLNDGSPSPSTHPSSHPSSHPSAVLHDQACALCASGTDTGSVSKTDQIRNTLPQALAVSANLSRVTGETGDAWSPHIARAPPGCNLSKRSDT